MYIFTNFFGRIFRNRWVRTFLIAALIAVLVWFVGPMIGFGQSHPLDLEIVRLLVIAGIFLFWLIWNLIQTIRASHREKALAAAMTEEDASKKQKDEAKHEEVAVVRDRLREALKTLKSSKLGNKKLALLPWYMFIGPPGAGKTTALVNSGLKFPLADKEGPTALRGVGGTRNCEWWFTDEAVLIDTAGRYTTQDSEADVDSAGWLGFLRMLKHQRKRQPINGVIIAISLSDLSTLSETERQAHAKAIRKRVRELNEELGVTPPIYVLFTKADLIAGFVEFYETLGKEDREQVWGATFPVDKLKGGEGNEALFAPEFDLLLERLNDRMLERVHQEPDIRRRRLIYGFPQQVASLREVAGDFLADCFRPSRLEPRAHLRGFYFASGTQEGTPIDRLLGTMASEFGLPRQSIGGFSGTGRSYFLTRLVRDVVFGEAALVSTDPKVERRIRWTHRFAYLAALLVLVLFGAAWTYSYFGNRQLIADVHEGTTKYAQQYEELTRRGPDDPDLPAVVPALDTLRGIHGGYGERGTSAPLELTFGLYQGFKLGAAADRAYVRALNRLLLPRLLSHLELQINASMTNPDALYQALKLYLILGRQGPLDKDLVLQWANLDLQSSYPGDDNGPLRDSVLHHVEALVNEPLEAIPLNDPLIAQARAVLTREPLAQYSYNRLLRTKTVTSIPPWSVAEYGGPEAPRVFRYRSGKPLDAGLPGIYTWFGYHNVFQPLLALVTEDIKEDTWVLGRPERDTIAQVRDTQRLRKDVFGLYLDDYTRQWDQILADVQIIPFTTVQDGLTELSALTSPSSPLRELLTNIDTQTQLSRPAATDQAAAAAQQRAGRIASQAGRLGAWQARTGLSFQQNMLIDVMSQAFGNDPATGKPIDPASRVDQHFKALHDFVAGTPEKPSPLEATIVRLNTVYSTFNQVASAPNQGQALIGMINPAGGGGQSPSAALQDAARTAPPAIAPMLQQIAASAAQVTSNGATQELSDAWKSKVLPRCDIALNRYPLVRASNTDVQLDDFVALLGPTGEIQKFFDQYLKSLVDTSQHPWKWLTPDRTPFGFSPTSLAEFERAADIRDSLFPNGATTLLVRFELNPKDLDPAVGQISIDLGGKRVSNAHGPTEPVQFQWPAPDGGTAMRVTMTPASGGNGDVRDFTGPWALLHMLDSGKITPTAQPDKFTFQFTGGGGNATFDLTASSVRNPFNLQALRSFRCPPKL